MPEVFNREDPRPFSLGEHAELKAEVAHAAEAFETKLKAHLAAVTEGYPHAAFREMQRLNDTVAEIEQRMWEADAAARLTAERANLETLMDARDATRRTAGKRPLRRVEEVSHMAARFLAQKRATRPRLCDEAALRPHLKARKDDQLDGLPDASAAHCRRARGVAKLVSAVD